MALQCLCCGQGFFDTMSDQKMEIRADMKKEIREKNKTQMAIIRTECDFDLELQMLVLGTIESHKKAKAQGCSISEAMAAAKADKADKQKAEREADKEENWAYSFSNLV